LGIFTGGAEERRRARASWEVGVDAADGIGHGVTLFAERRHGVPLTVMEQVPGARLVQRVNFVEEVGGVVDELHHLGAKPCQFIDQWAHARRSNTVAHGGLAPSLGRNGGQVSRIHIDSPNVATVQVRMSRHTTASECD
jgi:hypothetical protein